MRWMPPRAEFYKLNTNGAVQCGGKNIGSIYVLKGSTVTSETGCLSSVKESESTRLKRKKLYHKKEKRFIPNIQENTNETTAEGLIRDCRGDWSIGFCRNIVACSVLNSKLWAMYDGMRLAWRKVNLILEMDSADVPSLVLDI
ncbi:hypothetical protein J1N35_001985 [Gossypium stocksii]|uniref:RNase H type-1 domain-containing protein n=1 Tax=Gossypium stocksii TaxID=47602 RepID=A0A9D4ALX8_9ROSI|nr:hypothetical protein J1N35_001985 [Gossypium stocksii]